MRFLFLLLFSLTVSTKTQKINAMPLDWIFKTYIGVSYSVYRLDNNWSQVIPNNGPLNSITSFNNFELDGGFRVHKYFGISGNITQFKDRIISKGIEYNFKPLILSLDANFYLPLTIDALSLLGTGVELYGSLGGALFIDSIQYMAPKYGVGVQLRLLNALAFKIGMDFYHLALSNNNNIYKNIMPFFTSYKIGIQYYF